MKTYSRLLILAALCMGFAKATDCAASTIQWGVNIHDGGSDPQTLANKLAERNLKRVRMDLWGNDHTYLVKFRNAATILNAKGIRIEAVVFTVFSNGQSRCLDTNASLTEVEQTAYTATKSQIDSTKTLVHDYELQNEISLYPNIKVSGSTGQNASDYNVPCGRLQAAVLRGMSRAIDSVRIKSGLPLRIILGTTDRSFGLLTFMQQQGVLFDAVGYHIYPWKQHAALDQDPWFGTGGPLGQLAKFNKPITINEFNAGEIYSGTGGYSSQPAYENLAGQPVTEQGFGSIDKHLKEIVNQTVANVEALLFYEAWDEPSKAAPENRFGLYYDAPALSRPKISLYLASCYAAGALSQAGQDSLTKRSLGQCNITKIARSGNDSPKHEPGEIGIKVIAVHAGRIDCQLPYDGVLDICSLSGELVQRVLTRAGRFSVELDGTGTSEQHLSRNMYALRLTTNNQVFARFLYAP